jgi:hypothetical protein
MYRPIIIDNQGWLSETAGPIRVGAATQPYHAVTLAQVKKLLESGGIASSRSPFVSDLIGNIYDSVCGFCLREIGWFEALDYVYAGRVRSSMQWASNTVMPLVVYVLQDTIILKDDITSFTLSDSIGDEVLDYVYTGKTVDTLISHDNTVTITTVHISDTLVLGHFPTPYTLGDVSETDNNLDYIYTGTIVEPILSEDEIIVLPRTIIEEPITAVEVYAPYTLSDVSDSDGALGYVYDGIGVDPMVVTELYFSPELVQITDTMSLTQVEDGGIIYAALPADTDNELYPSDDIVVQKTKPKPMGETKTMSDGAFGYIEPR